MSGVKGRGGRPRLSAAEHLLRGTYRRDRHGPLPIVSDERQPQAIEPQPQGIASIETSAPSAQPPRDLSKAERAQWNYYAPLLASARALTPADRGTLADYCRACVAVDDRYRRLERAFRKRAFDKSIVRMLDSQARGWIDKKTKLAMELGLTAVSRSRLKWTGHQQRPIEQSPEKPKSKLAQLQEQAAELRRPVVVK